MIISRTGQFSEQITNINKITVEHLKEIEKYFISSELLNNINLAIDKVSSFSIQRQYDKYLLYINKINFYVEGRESSAIENIISNEDTHTEENNKKILSYIKQVNEINNLGKKLNNDIISVFHDNIEPSKNKGIRKDITQWIGDYKAPDGDNVLISLENFWDIYLGNNEFSEVDVFVRWAYQHLYFETIHPFDDGNGRTGRMLNLFFFKNQQADIFDNIIIETSTNIFNSRDDYSHLLKKSKVYVNPFKYIYPTEYKKSISKDIAFCEYLLNILCEKLNIFIDTFDKYIKVIDEVNNILESDKYLLKYRDLLLSFLSQYIIFDRNTFKEETKLSNDTISKLLKKLFDLNLLEYKNIKEIRNSKKILFKPFERFIN